MDGNLALETSDPVVLVGCGNMGYALLKGWVEAKTVDAAMVHVVEPQAALRERAAALGVNVHDASGTLPDHAAYVIIALKPQMLAELLPAYRKYAGSATFVSIAAGVSQVRLNDLLGGARVVRAMPNTPAAIGKGSTILFAGPGVSARHMEAITMLFSAGGAVHPVEMEILVDAATAISGSGPAYVFYFIECLARSAEELGLPPQLAKDLAKETVYGAGALAIESEDAPSELRRQVTSPKGTTEAALHVLSASDMLQSLLCRTTHAAFERSKELSAGT